MYYILSLERSGKNRRVYWKPGHNGYTENIDEAGIYGQMEALGICIEDINGNDIPVPVALALALDANVRANHVPANHDPRGYELDEEGGAGDVP